MAELDYYELLGVSADASRENIRAGYRQQVARAHPDVNASGDAEQRTALLNEAWSVLRDPATRAAYDAAGLATSAALRCQRCAGTTPYLRFVVFSRAQRGGLPFDEGSLVCPPCRKREARAAALASVTRGRYAGRRGRRATFGAIARDLRGGKVDRHTSAALLRQIGFAYARENRTVEALAALQAVVDFGRDVAVERIVLRLKEAGASQPAPTSTTVPASPSVSLPKMSDLRFGAVRLGARLRGALFAACAMLLVVGLLTARLGAGRRAAQKGALAPAVVQLARNVDPALRDDVARLAGAVRPSNVPGGHAYLFELANDKAFAAAYRSAVATLPAHVRAGNPWLVSLETTSQVSDGVAMPRSDDYVLARGCAPQRCRDGFVSVAYDASKHAVAGAAYVGERWHDFGSQALADRAMVVLAVAQSRLPLERRFALPTAREAELRRFIDDI